MIEHAASLGKTPAMPRPRIYRALQGTGGDVLRGGALSEADAVKERQAGRDVVVCGQDTIANRDLAEKIEKTANGNCKACPPHYAMGPGALPHFQPDPRPPDGHCFYETKTRKSKQPKKP
ncbi:MAG TPA: hypothetical protein VGN42_28275 [Pirellulales bacterium]|jgi:hypothetical protein|nr:hypothetical protein [Pirellulales bacterium]